jgi:hypothetical protein
MNTAPFRNLLYTLTRARLILEQIPLQASDLQKFRREKTGTAREIARN